MEKCIEMGSDCFSYKLMLLGGPHINLQLCYCHSALFKENLTSSIFIKD